MTRRKLSDQIVEDILRLIASEELVEGSAIPTESSLCTSYGVGRSVAREAGRSLAAKGFVIVRQGSSSVVAPRYLWNVLDPDFLNVAGGHDYFKELHEARELLEPQIASLAAGRATDTDIDELEVLTRQLRASEDDPVLHADLDIQFHELLASASKNPVLWSLHHSLVGLGHRQRQELAHRPGAIQRAAEWHEHIIEALKAHDAATASAAMRMHLNQVSGELDGLRETRQPRGAAPTEGES